MGIAYASKNGYLAIVKETTYATTPTTGWSFLPVAEDVAIALGQKFLANEALTGSPVMTIDQVQGVRSDDITFKCSIYADTFPLLLVAALGGADTVTGATYYTHVIKLLNSPTTGSQPPSFSIMLFDGANYWTLAGCRLDTLTIPFSSDGVVEATAKFIGNPAASTTAAPTGATVANPSAEVMIPGWSAIVNIASTPIAYVQSGELVIARNTAALFAEGSQSAYVNFAGPIKVTGKMLAIVATQADPWSAASPAQALTRDQLATVITFTDPNDVTATVNHSVAFTMSKTQYMEPKRTQGKVFVEVEANFEAISNATDTASGLSPISTTTINAVSAAYN